MKTILLLLSFFVQASQPVAGNSNEIWSESVRTYKNNYKLENLYSKKVDDKGKGDDELYGVRNFRVVLHGVLYRGGANNSYNKIKKRDNSNPLQKEGLENLCQQNFETAIYLYKTNFDQAPKDIACQSGGQENQIHYIQKSALESKEQIEILKMIHEHIVKRNPKPIYAHCWNGWHASGLVSALALMQFCNVSNEKALDYWIKNTDGNNKGYSKIKKRISTFKPMPELQIAAETQQLICPVM